MPAAGAPLTDVFLNPNEYSSAAITELLESAARGHTGVDRRWLHAILDRPGEALPALLGFAAEDRADDAVSLDGDLISMFRYLRAPEALPYFLRLIREDPEDVPDELLEAIVALGPAALEPLLALHEELGEENSGEIPFVLAALPAKDERVLRLLTERLEYDAADAAFCLEVYGDPAAIPAIEAVAAQVEDDSKLREELLDCVRVLRDPPPAELEPAAFDIWAQYPEQADPEWDVLTEEERRQLLHSDTPHLRAKAAATYANQEIPEEVLNVLMARLFGEETSDEERAGAAVGLAAHADRPEIAEVIEELYEEPATRERALEAMWRSGNPRFEAYPPKHLEDADLEIRREAIWGVGMLDLRGEAARLISHFENEDLREDALFNYTIAFPGEVKRATAKRVLARIGQLAKELSETEEELVKAAVDQRLQLQNMKPIFAVSDDAAPPAGSSVNGAKVGRNVECPCGSGKKYKKCHGAA